MSLFGSVVLIAIEQLRWAAGVLTTVGLTWISCPHCGSVMISRSRARAGACPEDRASIAPSMPKAGTRADMRRRLFIARWLSTQLYVLTHGLVNQTAVSAKSGDCCLPKSRFFRLVISSRNRSHVVVLVVV